ncbi:hypothetical protein NKH18_45820 [Streptomyces sp. M10(2022)]
MAIDRRKALSAQPTLRDITWTTRDVLLYHLSLGAGTGAATDPELHLTFERDLVVLPTFAVVAGSGSRPGMFRWRATRCPASTSICARCSTPARDFGCTDRCRPPAQPPSPPASSRYGTRRRPR